MREWNLSVKDPRSLTLAADARLTTPDYLDDQIWELTLSNGDPPAIRLYTNFGLRCRSFHLFPRFHEGEAILSDPGEFFEGPLIRQFFPNLISISFSPFPEIDVKINYWVPLSHALMCHMEITNNSTFHRQLSFEWIAILIPAEDGERMSPIEIQAAQVLLGRSNELVPIVFLTGGTKASSGSYPTLAQVVDLQPHHTHELVLSQVALSTPDESFNLARKIVAYKWDAERAKIELLNRGEVEIFTGDPDWDSTFALSQKVAYGLITGPTDHLPARSFVLSRRPDQGYSLTGDGNDYGYTWNGQSPFEAYTLLNLILPASPDIAQGLIRNFVSTQTDNGIIDWKPGLGGQRSNSMISPILATMTWLIHQYSEDLIFLQEIFPHLLNYFYAWFSEDRDRDGDGIPEWDHPLQAGIDDHPLFSWWQVWAHGLDITTVESPFLCALLYRECHSLIKMAECLSDIETISAIQTIADGLKTALDASWNEELATFQYWDRDSHTLAGPLMFSENGGPGMVNIQSSFEPPIRVSIRIVAQGEATRRPNIFIHGISQSGKHRVERIKPDQFQWFLGIGYATSDQTYTNIEHIDIQGLDNNDKITLQSVDLGFEDITTLMPLWARIPSDSQAEALVNQTITDPARYWHEFGLCSYPNFIPPESDKISNQVNIPWNIFIGEGLINYGYRAEAAELVTRIMKAIIKNLKSDGFFFQYYDANNGQGYGEKNTISGLAPVKLFLETLGVRICSLNQISLGGFNPFPWTVTVKYRGLTIIRQKEETTIIFPNDQIVNINDPKPRTISLELETSNI